MDVVNEYISGYNWDRPLAFIDNNRFVLACDNTNFNDEDFIYNQLRLYNIDDIKIDDSDNSKYRYLESYNSININLFSLDENHEVHGKLYFYKDNLIAFDFNKDYINIKSYNIKYESAKNIISIKNSNCFFNDDFGIIYYIDNDTIKEIDVNI
ncbi:hypothetical protein BRSU_0922 [Brachyspira suanatina]|uniref:Uncharacterized protein n=1 Tax=Brachyspira suanatina TaxID=381802 RepID=A0A0G4K6F4_9SPIR|nr:hypothetical protein [Brachyspira suanatina]CRF32632.1 hypothetical protein BRSU_0922 [Brachyspira suanatina]